MDAQERESYVEMVLSSDVSLTKPVEVLHRATAPTETNKQGTDSNSGLLRLADIALANDPDTDEVGDAIEDLFTQPGVLDVSQDELVLALGTVPSSTVEGLWKKAEWLLKTPNQVVVAPGCSPDARMVASSRNLDRPHLVIPGKAEGEFRCDKSCPQWNGLAVCSHVLATAQSTGKLLPFLQWYRNSKTKKKNGNLTALARTDMPANPGKKGGQSTSRARPERLPVDDVTKREYASNRHSYATPPNNEPFLLKLVTNRIQICQGCRTSIRGRGGRIEDPPFDFCVSRMERRPYPTPEGNFRIPTRASNCHYHLRMCCITAVEPSFVGKALKIPKEVECYLLQVHQMYLANEFGIQLQ